MLKFPNDKLPRELGRNLSSPQPPNQGWESGTFWPLHGFILDFREKGFGIQSYSVEDYSSKKGSKKVHSSSLPADRALQCVLIEPVLANCTPNTCDRCH